MRACRFHTSTLAAASRRIPKISKNRDFDSSFSSSDAPKPQKIWDQRGISKHEFFIRKYGNISPGEREKLDRKVQRQKYLREQRRIHEAGELPPKPTPVITNNLAEYLFGTHAVTAALQGDKRHSVSKLYHHEGKDSTRAVVRLASKLGIRTVGLTKQELNRLSNNGVHNGVVLETRPLQLPVLHEVGEFEGSEGSFSLSLEDNDSSKATPKIFEVSRQTPQTASASFPLGVLLDGITDPQNLGNIVRSAYYLGADFVVVPAADSARLGPVAAKAAVGALDLMPIYKTSAPLELLDRARQTGWNVVLTASRSGNEDVDAMRSKHQQPLRNQVILYDDLPGIMAERPMLMVFGSEGAGVRAHVKFRSDYLVGLETGRVDNQLVDSLNVGVAAGMMIGKCLE